MTENTEIKESKASRHWPTILLGILVAAVFLVAIFTFQVKSTEYGLVTTFGSISRTINDKGGNGGGLCFRWPYPIQAVYKFDNRNRCFIGGAGESGETITADKKNVIVGIYVIYRIKDPKTFYKMVVNIPEAEKRLSDYMRTRRNTVIGQYKFSQLINTNSKKMILPKIENDMKRLIQGDAKKIGLSIEAVGIRKIQFPENISEKVSKRMIREREKAAEEYLAEGRKEANIIKSNADKEKANIEATASAEAKAIRAEGDAKAAEFYAVFRQNPQLAAFLKKLDSLRKILKTRTTLVLDTDAAPFDILKMGSDQFEDGKIKPVQTKSAKSGK